VLFDELKHAIKVRERSITWVVVRLAGQIARKTANKEIRHNVGGQVLRCMRVSVVTNSSTLIYRART
jgi:hypothetical protein